MQEAQSPIVYLKKELNIGLSEYMKLAEKDKTELKQYAAEEMAVLGIPVK